MKAYETRVVEQELPHASLWERVRCPGLTPAAGEISRLVAYLPKGLAVFSYKLTRPELWVVFMGGTGTGKSTLFNALCGADLSDTGVERPKTFGPIAYVHRNARIEAAFPLQSIHPKRIPAGAQGQAGQSGASGLLLVLEHTRDDLSHLVMVDTPDIDSVELKNRQAVEDLYLLADLVIFVASEEKYADEVPFQFLSCIHREGKPYVLVLNKIGASLTADEVLASFRLQGLDIRGGRIKALPYLSANASERLTHTAEFGSFASEIWRVTERSRLTQLLRNERERSAGQLRARLQTLTDLLGEEKRAADKWLDHLDLLFDTACRNLFEQQERRFGEESRTYLQGEIRRHFSKYDLLGRPRRMIARVVLAPLRLLGLKVGARQESHQEALERIRKRIDLAPIHASLIAFNRSALEKLSPQDETSPLYRNLRDPAVLLTAEEVRTRVFEEQKRLAGWLEQTFSELARGIPKSKEWGIYTTSILWGGLILALETAIGGGISILEAVLDSAVAPFVTKGAVELFAYHELQRIGREVGERYREGLISVIRLQRDRYIYALECLLSSEDTLEDLRKLQAGVTVD